MVREVPTGRSFGVHRVWQGTDPAQVVSGAGTIGKLRNS
jgi:hypothetical protein